MRFLFSLTEWPVLVNLYHFLPKIKTREKSLPHLSCHSNAQLHKKLLKNDGKRVSSNTQDIFKANVPGTQKVSLPFIINEAAPGCKSE